MPNPEEQTLSSNDVEVELSVAGVVSAPTTGRESPTPSSSSEEEEGGGDSGSGSGSESGSDGDGSDTDSTSSVGGAGNTPNTTITTTTTTTSNGVSTTTTTTNTAATSQQEENPPQVQYNDITLSLACAKGMLPTAVLLWGMHKAQNQNPMSPDADGNNPLHYAALADTPEVLEFIIGQGGGKDINGGKLVDSRNADGETPLLRACTLGKMEVVKALISYGSNFGLQDDNNNTVLHNAARNGHLDLLILLLHITPPLVAKALLSTLDVDGHTCLDWAAYHGHTNAVEFLIFRGVDPCHLDQSGRNSLHWAAKQGKIETTAYLLSLGVNSNLKDKEGNTAVMFARSSPELRDVFLEPWKWCGFRAGGGMAGGWKKKMFLCGAAGTYVKDNWAAGGGGGGGGGEEEEHLEKGQGKIDIVTKVQKILSGLEDGDNGQDINPSLNRINPTRIHCMMFYAITVASVFIASMYLKWWITILIAVGEWGAIYWARGVVKDAEKRMQRKTSDKNIRMKGLVPEVLRAYENMIGIWLGCALSFCFALANMWVRIERQEGGATDRDRIGDVGLSSIDLMAISAEKYEFAFVFMTVCFVCMVIAWWLLAFVYTDPGVVYQKRYKDYSELVASVGETKRPIDSRKYCTTTLVRKPQRAKFDSPCGLLVAKHDHHCVWLNNAIGFKNHRNFMVFLIFQVAGQWTFSIFGWISMCDRLFALGMGGDLCDIVYGLFDDSCFGLFTLTMCASACSLGLGFLLAQQCNNIRRNITTNERMNAKRYPWIMDDENNFFIRFSRGSIKNIVEFIFSGVDYQTTYDIPPLPSGYVGRRKRLGGAHEGKDADAQHPLLADSLVEGGIKESSKCKDDNCERNH